MNCESSLKIKMFFIIVSFCAFACIQCETEDIFLNSFENCQRSQVYEVSHNKDYFIRPDELADYKTSTFRDCEITFHSYKENGRICLLQTGNVGRILDPNAQLEARDGLGDQDDRLIATLQNPDVWKMREYCSEETPYITIYLKEILKTKGADIKKVEIQFRVVDIESDKRVFYLDGTYCDRHYPLNISRVTLSNRPESQDMTRPMLTSECGIRFDMLEGSQNRRICFGYVPSEKVDCSQYWRFSISLGDFSLNEESIKYSLKCDDVRAGKMHVWCTQPDVQFVTVIYWRGNNTAPVSPNEPPGMFQYLIRDYEGSEERFHEELKAMYATKRGGFPTEWIIYTLVAVGILFVLIGIGIWCKRRKRYKPVQTGGASKAV